MRGRLTWVVLVAVLSLGAGSVGAEDEVGAPVPLGAYGLQTRMAQNSQLRSFISLRGYPDWAEEVEVGSGLPLAPHEVRLYYFRLDREVSFANAYILGQPAIGLRLFARPIPPETRERLRRTFLALDPAGRAELAAARANELARSAERAATAAETLADQAEETASAMERSFHASLRK